MRQWRNHASAYRQRRRRAVRPRRWCFGSDACCLAPSLRSQAPGCNPTIRGQNMPARRLSGAVGGANSKNFPGLSKTGPEPRHCGEELWIGEPLAGTAPCRKYVIFCSLPESRRPCLTFSTASINQLIDENRAPHPCPRTVGCPPSGDCRRGARADRRARLRRSAHARHRRAGRHQRRDAALSRADQGGADRDRRPVDARRLHRPEQGLAARGPDPAAGAAAGDGRFPRHDGAQSGALRRACRNGRARAPRSQDRRRGAAAADTIGISRSSTS